MEDQTADGAKAPSPRAGAATRARIVEAAAQLVGDRGVAGTSLDDIMAASQTSKSQLYHYFVDKDALVCAVGEALAGKVIGFQESCLKNVRSLADLRKWRNAVVKLNRARRGVGGCPIGSLASELSDRSEAARALLADSFQTWESHLVAAFQAIIANGELRASTDPNNLATAADGERCRAVFCSLKLNDRRSLSNCRLTWLWTTSRDTRPSGIPDKDGYGRSRRRPLTRTDPSSRFSPRCFEPAVNSRLIADYAVGIASSGMRGS